jgi:hypothetical protein
MVDGLHVLIELEKETSCNCFKWDGERIEGERWWGCCKPMYNISLFRIVTMNLPCTTNIS